eukprot:SAG25_NODE_2455_length_1595_cov_1.294118_1_plen_61_part_00
MVVVGDEEEEEEVTIDGGGGATRGDPEEGEGGRTVIIARIPKFALSMDGRPVRLHPELGA